MDTQNKTQREIKFRAWNVATKVMVDLKKITPLALNMDTDGLFIPFSDGLPLMQFTGLYDKNGKEIYEGDIVQDYKNNLYQEILYTSYIIKWDINCFNTRRMSWLSEVIGNIYENGNLLDNNSGK